MSYLRCPWKTEEACLAVAPAAWAVTPAAGLEAGRRQRCSAVQALQLAAIQGSPAAAADAAAAAAGAVAAAAAGALKAALLLLHNSIACLERYPIR